MAAQVVLAKEKEELDGIFAKSAHVSLPDLTPEEDTMGCSAVQKILKLG